MNRTEYEHKVKTDWMDQATADAWREWHDRSKSFRQELIRALLEIARLAPGQRVLDLASGSGDPALDVARRVAPGQVVATDLSPPMLDVARGFAARDGVANISFEIADAHALAFADASFDRVTCQLGVMFFWDCQRALAEIRRVLKPGGIAAFVAWGKSEEVEYMRLALAPFGKRRPLPPLVRGAPHPARFGEPGSLSAELKAAGFSAVREETRRVPQIWEGTPEELWRRIYEVGIPLRPYFEGFSAEERQAAVREVLENFTQKYDGARVSTQATIILASGSK